MQYFVNFCATIITSKSNYILVYYINLGHYYDNHAQGWLT